MSDSTMAVSSKYTQDLSDQIVFFTFSFKWFLFLLLGCNLSYIVDLFAAFHQLSSASARTLLKLASSVRALKTLWRHLKPRPNDRNMPTQHVPTMLDAQQCCDMLLRWNVTIVWPGLKDVRAHYYWASLVRALFIRHARATSCISSALTESKLNKI